MSYGENIIIAPVITEKSHDAMEKGVYVPGASQSDQGRYP